MSLALAAVALSLSVGGTIGLNQPAAAADDAFVVTPATVGYHASDPVDVDTSVTPSHQSDRTVVDVTDYGADPTGKDDSAQAIQDAVDHAKSLDGPVTISFPKGTYQIYPENTATRDLYVSNTVGTDQSLKTKHIAVLIEGMSDVVVEGNGSKLMFHGKQTMFAAIDSHDVTFQNFDTDWVAPGTIDLTVVDSGTTDAKGYRDIQVPPGTSYSISGTSVAFSGEQSPAGTPYWTYSSSSAGNGWNQQRVLSSGKTVRTGAPVFNNAAEVTDLGDNRFRVTYSTDSDPGDAGSTYELRDTTRDTPAVFIWRGSETELSGIHFGYLHGFGIVGQMTENVTLNRVRLQAPAGTWRQTAGFADFVQMSGVKGKVQVTNSLFDNPHDDPINIHGTYLEVAAIDRDDKTVTLEYEHSQTAGFAQYFPGDQVQFVTKSTMLPLSGDALTVAEASGPDADTGLSRTVVKFNEDIPDGVEVGSTVAENLTYTPQVYVAGNTFQSVPTRGLLVTTPQKTVVERNVFDQMSMASIYVSGDAAEWYESGAVHDLTIRHNLFTRPSGPVILFEPTNQSSVAGQTVHDHVNIEANTFVIENGVQLLNAKSVSDLTFSGNRVKHYTASDSSGPATSDQALFSFNGSARVDLSGNSYESGFNRRADIANMSADEVGGSDGVTVGSDNPSSSTATSSDLSWVREDPSRWSTDGDSVVLESGTDTLWSWQNAAGNLLLHDANPDATAESAVVKITGATQSQWEEAGLIFYTDDDNYVEVMRKHNDGSPKLALVTETGGSPSEDHRVDAPADEAIWLKLRRSGSTFTASYSTDGATYTRIGRITNDTVTSPRIGILADGASDADTPFTFSDLTIDGAKQTFPTKAEQAVELGDVSWEGVSFGTPASSRAWLASTGTDVSSVSATFPVAAGLHRLVTLNDDEVAPDQNGSYAFTLQPGANVIQVSVYDDEGGLQTYRWIILSTQD